MLTQARLRELLTYDAESGKFKWKVKRAGNGKEIGEVAGYVHPRGYVVISVDCCQSKAHRLAFLYMEGTLPAKSEEVDHWNGDKQDNRWDNLRKADRFTNTQNIRSARKDNTSGFLGVSTSRQGFVAAITSHKVRHHLGTFTTPEEAYQAYLKAKRELHVGCTI